MKTNWQPTLENESILLKPLLPTDFNLLYEVASDPKIWAQHPNQNRWQKEVFKVFFEGALASAGAFIIYDKATDKPIGSTRFYEENKNQKTVLIGYTFYAVAYWGKGYNAAVKKMMLAYAFNFVETVHFHVGAQNYRSQKAMEKLNAIKIDELLVRYYGEANKLNFVYEITKANFMPNELF